MARKPSNPKESASKQPVSKRSAKGISAEKSAKKTAKTSKTTKKPIKTGTTVVKTITPRKRPQRGKRPPQAVHPTPQEEANILERQELVFELVKNGASFRKISDYLKSKGYKASIGQVHADFQAALALRRDKFAITVDEWAVVELEKLADAESAFMPRLRRDGEHNDVLSLKITMRERDRIIGFSKKQRADNEAKLALAKLLGVTPEELPDERDDGDQ